MFLRCFLALGLCAGTSIYAQSDPGWWSDVLRSGPHPNSGNYAPANLGQLKNFADKARIHLNAELPGGAGSAIESMVTSWPSNPPDAYSPINLGQLKFVVDKFYTRLDEENVPFKTQLNNNGYGGVWTPLPNGKERPWNEPPVAAENYAPANLGQLKVLFSFDLTGFTPGGGNPGDNDGDGILDVDEPAAGLVVGVKDNPAIKLTVSVILR